MANMNFQGVTVRQVQTVVEEIIAMMLLEGMNAITVRDLALIRNKVH